MRKREDLRPYSEIKLANAILTPGKLNNEYKECVKNDSWPRLVEFIDKRFIYHLAQLEILQDEFYIDVSQLNLIKEYENRDFN